MHLSNGKFDLITPFNFKDLMFEMKYIILTTIVLCLGFSFSSVIAQSKIELGLTAEGSWFMPEKYSKNAPTNKDGLGAGIGVYASKSISKKLSANIGLNFRYKEMQELVDSNYRANAFNIANNYSPYDGGYGSYGGYGGYGGYGIDYGSNYSYEYVDFWKKYPHHYIVVPISLQLFIYKDFFILAGAESTWLINYNFVDQKPEFNGVVGLGTQMKKFKWSVNYIRGFKDQTFNNEVNYYGGRTYTTYRNNMVQFSISYALWQK